MLPEVPVRQWVLSLPFALCYRLAYDARLVRDVLHIFVAAVFGSLRRRARDHSGLRQAQCGAVTFVQRFGGALNLNVHFHTLVLDGVYAADTAGRARFHPLPAPDDAEVARVTVRIASRILALLERRGLGPQGDPDEADPLRRDQPFLAELYGASVQGCIATGPHAGRRVTMLGDRIDAESPAIPAGSRCAPPPRFNLVRYHGVLAPAARSRTQIVPPIAVAEAGFPPHSGCRAHPTRRSDSRSEAGISRKQPTRPRLRSSGSHP